MTRRSLFCIVTILTLISDAHAQSRVAFVDFDTAYYVSAKDVTPKDFGLEHPGRKIVQIGVTISANFSRGEADCEELVYKLHFDPDTTRVADYAPRNDLQTDVVGTIATKENTTKTSQLEVRAGGSLGAEFSVRMIDINLGGSAEGSSKTRTEAKSETQFNRLPNKQLILATGFESSRTKVYYKLRPFSQNTLEGEKQFVVLCDVPANWERGVVVVECIGRKLRQASIIKRVFATKITLSGVKDDVTIGSPDPIAELNRWPKVGAETQWLNIRDSLRNPGAIWVANLVRELWYSTDNLAGDYVCEATDVGRLDVLGYDVISFTLSPDGKFGLTSSRFDKSVKRKYEKRYRGELYFTEDIFMVGANKFKMDHGRMVFSGKEYSYDNKLWKQGSQGDEYMLQPNIWSFRRDKDGYVRLLVGLENPTGDTPRKAGESDADYAFRSTQPVRSKLSEFRRDN